MEPNEIETKLQHPFILTVTGMPLCSQNLVFCNKIFENPIIVCFFN